MSGSVHHGAALPGARKRRVEHQVVPDFGASEPRTPSLVPGAASTGMPGSGSGYTAAFGRPALSPELSPPGLLSDPTSGSFLPDFESLYTRMRATDGTGIPVEDRRWRLLTYQKCFVGSDAVDWLVKAGIPEIDSREKAVDFGRLMVTDGVVHHVTHSEPFSDSFYFYRFQEDDDSSVLNLKRLWPAEGVPVRPAEAVAQELITKLACLVEEHRVRMTHRSSRDADDQSSPSITDPTTQPPSPNLLVSGPVPTGYYARLGRSDDFRRYVLASAELQRVDLSPLDLEGKVSFWCNVYNALVLHAHAIVGPPSSFVRRWTFFRGLRYRIGGLDYTLDDIEHGILRGNRKPPSLKFMQQLGSSDPRCALICLQRDPRIHFVISAGTESDPPVRILDPDSVDEELHEAAEEFLNRCVKLSIEGVLSGTSPANQGMSVADAASNCRTITLPRIFSWYAEDFTQPDTALLRWIAQYLKTERQAIVLAIVQQVTSNKRHLPPIVYENFNWGNPEARFEAAVVRRKRRRLERELAALEPTMIPVNRVGGVPGFTDGSVYIRSTAPGDGPSPNLPLEVSRPAGPAINSTSGPLQIATTSTAPVSEQERNQSEREPLTSTPNHNRSI